MKSTKVMVEVAIMIAMAFVLELAFSFMPAMPQGGRVSLSLLPIIVVAWRHGVVPGLVAGFLFSGLNMMLDGFGPAAFAFNYKVFLASLFLDYVLAFSLVGIAGIVRRPLGDNVYNFAFAIFIGFTVRFIMHLISGAVLFGQWAPDGQNVWMYSLIYNGTYLLPALILTMIVGIGIYFPLKSYSENEQYT